MFEAHRREPLKSVEDAFQSETGFGPWNPGIESSIPLEFAPLATIFRPENISSNFPELRELSEFSGISMEELAVFKPERLVVHEVLVRVIADLWVPDGDKYEDLGQNFRRMTSTIISKYVLPRMDEVTQLYDDLQMQISELMHRELADSFERESPPSAPERKGLFSLLGFGRKERPASLPSETAEDRGARILSTWERKADAAHAVLERRAYQALIKAASAVIRRHGHFIGDATLLTKLAVPLACNAHRSEAIGHHIEPYFLQGVAEEGYKLLPYQAHPVIMDVKGASASGKSTLRPLQKQLAARLGIPWNEVALISTDIWRKFLLDYDSLGAARRYAGSLTGQEFVMIDKKLDHYLVGKGEKGHLPHLVIDRFRFDSFSPSKSGRGAFIERFGHDIYVFFMITPPEATVDRAWERGQRFGRYKAVDDLLYHNVEAYTGMPQLYLSGMGIKDSEIHFEFLDNSVPKGTTPKTVAFGTNKELNILDVKSFIDIERFKKINISARRPEDIYIAAKLASATNTGFLVRCARATPVINFVEARTGRIYAKIQRGGLTTYGPEPSDPDVRVGLAAIAAEVCRYSHPVEEELGTLVPGDAPTLGAWGAGHAAPAETPVSPAGAGAAVPA